MALDKWVRRYLRLASEVAGRSKDPSTKIGAVIADNQGRVVALGYNGFPRNIEDAEEKLALRELKYEMVVHAEVNAVLIAGRSTAGGTVYVHGLPICPRCASVLIQAGITRAVAKAPRSGTDRKWDKDGFIALDMFKEAKIVFDPVDDASEPRAIGQVVPAAAVSRARAPSRPGVYAQDASHHRCPLTPRAARSPATDGASLPGTSPSMWSPPSAPRWMATSTRRRPVTPSASPDQDIDTPQHLSA